MPDVGGQVFNYFRQKGLSPAQAAGIVGNFQQESSLNPYAQGGGLDQGQGSRFHAGNLAQQLDAIWGELQGPERGTLGALKGAGNARQAARIFSERFERPGIPMLSNRERYAQEALGRFGGGQPGQPAPERSQGATGGSPGTPGTAATGLSGPALMAAIQGLMAKPDTTSVQGLSIPKPGSEGQRVPQNLNLGQPAAAPADLVAAAAQLAGEGGTPGKPATPGVSSPSAPAPPGSHGGPLSGFVAPGTKVQERRTDKGKDVQLAPGTPLIANGSYEVVAVPSDPSGFGPAYPVVKFLSGPDAGHTIYFGHVDAAVKPGQRGGTGDVLAHTSRTGHNAPPGWAEIGLWGPGGPLAGPGDSEGPAGRTIARLLGFH